MDGTLLLSRSLELTTRSLEAIKRSDELIQKLAKVLVGPPLDRRMTYRHFPRSPAKSRWLA
jgi:hypothetical protein